MVHQLHGLTYLMEVLDLLLDRTPPTPLTDSDAPAPLLALDAAPAAPRLTAPNVALASEILKILFNLTITVDKNNLDEVSIWLGYDVIN
jgi:hypothetical protein